MKRYCRIEVEKNNFAKTDKVRHMIVYYQSVARHVLQECAYWKEDRDIKTFSDAQALLDGLFGKRYFTENIEDNAFELNNMELITMLKSVILSDECALDVFNDMYLSFLEADNQEEKLFLDSWHYNNGTDKEVLDQVKEAIRGIKKREKRGENKTAILFDISNMLSTQKDSKIDCLGANVVRLWWMSERFRQLFADVTTYWEKYRIEDICCILRTGEKAGLNFKSDDFIILDKLLGLNTYKYFVDYIYKQVKDCKWMNFDILQPLLDALMQCKSSLSRCMHIQVIGWDLNQYIGHMRNPDEMKTDILNRIDQYTKLIKRVIKIFEENYEKILNAIILEMQEIYSFEKAWEIIRLQKEMLLEGRIGGSYLQSIRPYFEEYEREMKYCAQQLRECDDETIARYLIEKEKNKGCISSEFCFFMDSLWRVDNWIVVEEEMIPMEYGDENTRRILGYIIQKSFRLYIAK